ncbi:hypothetical protein Q4610_19440 [Sphingobium sp. HBC34]|uniref:Uncharacterized protein n=1 Tax=Sphingobium cyanobacteriorum TaxID=3063954 RepID=A0ABT8ZRP7_9SPHN|nr:hypothetical protein [Sphingobium sp. HBC34]MDO7837223.1 hypothetical protein [Sphingobium sp. HBC34]
MHSEALRCGVLCSETLYRKAVCGEGLRPQSLRRKTLCGKAMRRETLRGETLNTSPRHSTIS